MAHNVWDILWLPTTTILQLLSLNDPSSPGSLGRERSPKWWEGQGSSACKQPGCEQTPAGWKVQQGFSKGAENYASRDKPQPLKMTKRCDPGQVSPLQQIRHVLVWLFSESNCKVQILYYKNLCSRTLQPFFLQTLVVWMHNYWLFTNPFLIPAYSFVSRKILSP